MFRIRKMQMAAFAAALVKGFEDRMAAHLAEEFPERCGHGRDEEVRSLIRLGIERARSHGVVEEYDVCLYLHLMVMLGRDFDQDPALTWAGALLESDERAVPGKVERIYDRVMAEGGTAGGGG